MNKIKPLLTKTSLNTSNIISRSKNKIVSTTQKIAHNAKSQMVGASLALATLVPLASSCVQQSDDKIDEFALTTQDYKAIELTIGLNKDEADAVVETLSNFAEKELGAIDGKYYISLVDDTNSDNARFRLIMSNLGFWSNKDLIFDADETGSNAIIEENFGYSENKVKFYRTENKEIEIEFTNVKNNQKTVLKTKPIENIGKNELNVGIKNANVKTQVMPVETNKTSGCDSRCQNNVVNEKTANAQNRVEQPIQKVYGTKPNRVSREQVKPANTQNQVEQAIQEVYGAKPNRVSRTRVKPATPANHIDNVKKQMAIFQAMPYIANGKFKDTDVMSNGLIMNDVYKMHQRGGNYSGRYSLTNGHTIAFQKLNNGNFNLIYEYDDNYDVIAFSKDGKMLSLFEAFRQNSKTEPVVVNDDNVLDVYKRRFWGDFSDQVKEDYKNSKNKIFKFSNPLSEKELKIIKGFIGREMRKEQVNKVEYKNGVIRVEYGYANSYDCEFKNSVGLNFSYSLLGYFLETQQKPWGYKMNRLVKDGPRRARYLKAVDIKYYDTNLVERDEKWWRDQEVYHMYGKHALESYDNIDKALENLKAGRQSVFLGDDGKLYTITPLPDQKVVGETDVKVLTANSIEELKTELKKLQEDVVDKVPGPLLIMLPALGYAFWYGATLEAAVPAYIAAPVLM